MKNLKLENCFTQPDGKVFLTGTKALLRIMLDQARRDQAAGINTKGFVTGYRGSPLGMVDIELYKNKKLLNSNNVEFLPAINEELAATEIYGTQQVEIDEDKQVDAVFGMWYGKGPGVDRAADALKHGNAYGSSPNGGVLAVAGDDHGCLSSTMGHQSDVAFMSFMMPIVYPADIGEFLEYGEYGYALSRFSGTWVGFKAISEITETAMNVELKADRKFVKPDFDAPADGLHIRWLDFPGPQVEERLSSKINAVAAFARANPIDRTVYNFKDASFGIVTSGKAYYDVLEALQILGIDKPKAEELGIDIYKVALIWPLEHKAALEFAKNKQNIFVVEEKRAIVESQLKERLYDYQGEKPKTIVGKYDENDKSLLPWVGEISPKIVAKALATRLDLAFGGNQFSAIFDQQQQNTIGIAESSSRSPYFCSGCPHSTGTKIPEGSRALSGIGCHIMATYMQRDTTSIIQMGGEGTNWVTLSKFNGGKHIFQNMGDGTYFHSGILSIRQAVSANINITFKILFNDAVAMTGGQHIDGVVTPEIITKTVLAEGVAAAVIVSDDPKQVDKKQLASAVKVYHRDDLNKIQQQLKTTKGVTVLVYQQQCAAEKRRLRKKNKLADPSKYVVINPLVCEGCGDCSNTSNCLSVTPLDTEFGRKRQIDLSTCNKDYTCVDGFCPSFVTVEGAELKQPNTNSIEQNIDFNLTIPTPALPKVAKPYNLLLAGIGGTGVISVGKFLAVAAKIDNIAVKELDFMGLAQKFGPVLVYLRFGNNIEDLNQSKITENSADAVIGYDVVVATTKKALATYKPNHTKAVINTAEVMTADFIHNREFDLAIDKKLQLLNKYVDFDENYNFDVSHIAEKLLGNKIYSNIILIGLAYQNGLLPISIESIIKAIELHGIDTETNKKAIHIGRILGNCPSTISSAILNNKIQQKSLAQQIATRKQFLTEYQNSNWATNYTNFIDKVVAIDTKLDGNMQLSLAVVKGLFKVMSYKDEYEVARLHTAKQFKQDIADKFSGNYKIHHYLAPPLMPLAKDNRGYPKKKKFGSFIRLTFTVLAKFKFLRGSMFDIFSYHRDRKIERQLIVEYKQLISDLLTKVNAQNYTEVVAIATLIMTVKGFGPVKDKAVTEYRQQLKDSLLIVNC